MPDETPLILASASMARRAMCEAAGLTVRIVPADIDEAALTETLHQSSPVVAPDAVALALARAKAVDVSSRHPGALVIGSDQVLSCDGRLFSKAHNRDEARATLQALRGRAHELTSAVALARDGRVVWSDHALARLTVRPFSEAYLDLYVENAGAALLRSVGAYELESAGVQLFDSIEGDYFTILGMPLLPLLAALRQFGVLPT
ncbi:MAG: Maf family protein [Hyphomicrobium sp.]